MISDCFPAAMSGCPDQQDKRWREQSLRGKLTFQSARATRRATARTGWLVDIAYSCARHGVCREFTPVFAKHLRSFWLLDSLAIGVDRMKRNFVADAKEREKRGSMREKGIDGRRHRRGGLLQVGRPTGNYSIRGHKGVSRYLSGEISYKRTSGPRQRIVM
jgi:hypothetical protein